LVLADNLDSANGLANVFPSNRAVVFVHPPIDDVSLAFYDDWLELVITHELAHVFHLDESGSLSSLLRSIFGRYPSRWPFFPGLSSPTWTIEGMATYYESAMTGSGRAHGSYAQMVLRTAALEGRFESIDQVSGQSPVWPAGDRPYAYGSLFFDHLMERYGQDRMADFVQAGARQLVPYRLNAAAGKAFGTSFSAAWRDWQSEVEARYSLLADSLAAHAPLTEGETIARSGRYALHPRFSPDGSEVAYARSDGRSDPQIAVVRADGSPVRSVGPLNGVESMAWFPDGAFVVAQIEYVDPYRLTKDLYRVERGERRRLTRGERLYHPDVAPGGGAAVAVQNGPGTTRLVRVDLETGRVQALSEFRSAEQWAFPRWSPDARFIAASRWRPGARYDVVILDRDGRLVTEVTDDRAVDMAPAWSPDGRWLIWSSDRSGIPNLYAADVSGLAEYAGAARRAEDAARLAVAARQVTNLVGGAFFPDVSPDGRWIAYADYHADGWRIAKIPFDPERWIEPLPAAVPPLDGVQRDSLTAALAAAQVVPSARPYAPARSLLPRYWAPLYAPPERVGERTVLPAAYGALTSGRDLVGRHQYTLWAGLNPDRGRLEGGLEYDYAGLGNPLLGIELGQQHASLGGVLGRRADATIDTLFVTERERRFGVFATFLRPRLRTNASVTLSGALVREDRQLLELDLSESRRYSLQDPVITLGEASLTLAYTNARRHAFSISAENGVGGFVRLRARRELDLPDSLRGVRGDDGSFGEVTSEIRVYLAVPGPGYARHVLAARVSAGNRFGSGADADHFELGGAAGTPEPVTGLGLFGGTRLLFPLRGYSRAARLGNRVWSASAEYRVPIWLAHRGSGLRPLYLDRVFGSLFVDAGNAWGPSDAPSEALISTGAELAARILPLWTSSL
ncbi:MAG: PD40 domain-containing protein, partial [Gemmatimonadetes bacterium]|nr:PD40 domain-containing protein [Gemmatimonadota bacterium]